MKKLELTPRKLVFVVGTRALLGTGVGLLLSGKVPTQIRRRVGLALVALGALTTIPAIQTLRAASR
jgi:hypothetical protein